MADITLERVTEQAKALTTEQQRQLRALLDSWLTPTTDAEMPERERQFVEDMVAKGVLSNIPLQYLEGYVPDDFDRHPPIVVRGEPVSETIIRERR
jgi:hypothetical protein